jgi:histidinol-phosphate/aromatic aminotransferase/cobyric acid decarboxylase-like protein
MAVHYIQRLRELVAVAESNRGSAAVNAALDRYAQAESASLLVASSVSLRDLVALRGKVLGLLHKVPKAEEAFTVLQKAGVIVRPLRGYGMIGWLRLTVGTEAQNARLLAELAKL